MKRKTIIDGFEKHGNRLVPVVRCSHNRQRGTYSFYCQFCGTYHTHGDIDGHRISHCFKDNSWFRSGGYIIKKNEVVGQ